MLASGEIFGIPSIVVFAFLWWWYYYCYKKDDAPQEGTYSSVSFCKSISWPSPNFTARWLIMEGLEKVLGFQIVPSGELTTTQVFQRGKIDITSPTGVNWRDLPITLTVEYSDVMVISEASLHFAAPKTMQFSKTELDSFHTYADYDFQAILEFINTPQAESSVNDDDADSEGTDDDDETLSWCNAYRCLGLEPGDSWESIQTSYRQLCRKFHPDTLARHSMPSHIEELATERFREATAAYQLLKTWHRENTEA